MKSTAAILATAMFVGDCTMASASLTSIAAVTVTINQIEQIHQLSIEIQTDGTQDMVYSI